MQNPNKQRCIPSGGSPRHKLPLFWCGASVIHLYVTFYPWVARDLGAEGLLNDPFLSVGHCKLQVIDAEAVLSRC